VQGAKRMGQGMAEAVLLRAVYPVT
jgi:hypothetical protein